MQSRERGPWDTWLSYLFAFAFIAGWLTSSPGIMARSGPLLLFLMMLGLLAVGWNAFRNRRWLSALVAVLLAFWFNPWARPDFEDVPWLVYALAYEGGLVFCLLMSQPLKGHRRRRFSRWLANL